MLAVIITQVICKEPIFKGVGISFKFNRWWVIGWLLIPIEYPQHPVAGVFLMVVFCVLMTPILMYFREKSGSVIVPAIMHGTFNALAGLSLLLVTPANDYLYGATGLAGFIAQLGYHWEYWYIFIFQLVH